MWHSEHRIWHKLLCICVNTTVFLFFATTQPPSFIAPPNDLPFMLLYLSYPLSNILSPSIASYPPLFLPFPTSVSMYPVLIFSDKLIQVEAALLPVQIEDSHRRPSVVQLINQPPLQHGKGETCICSDGACSYTSPIVINRTRSSEKGLCSLYSCTIVSYFQRSEWQN